MDQNDKYLRDKLNAADAELATASANEVGASSPAPKKKGGGTGSFIVGFIFGLLGVLISCCWGGAGAAFRGFLWRLGITIVIAILGALANA